MDATFTRAHRGGSGPPMVCVHGFTDTWRTWELVLPALERNYDVLAPTLAGHAGGPAIDGEASGHLLADALEGEMDRAGFETAHVVGNSLGGYVSLQLAERGRAKSVVALAPAGGWAPGHDSYKDALDYFTGMQETVKAAVPYVDEIVATPEGRRLVTQYITTNFEHIPADLLTHQMIGVARCEGLRPLLELGRREGWPLDPARIGCPVRVVWGTADKVLPWPDAAVRYRDESLPDADWVLLDGVGHCPQLDVPRETAELILGFEANGSDAGTAGDAARPAGAV
jgi:pimeloyl-ACP methyl ester carboxylesterase